MYAYIKYIYTLCSTYIIYTCALYIYYLNILNIFTYIVIIHYIYVRIKYTHTLTYKHIAHPSSPTEMLAEL